MIAPQQDNTLFPVRESARPRNRRTWTADEKQFADRLIDWWTHCSKEGGTARANNVQGNRDVAVRLYRWLCQQAKQDEAMTEGDVQLAIQAYSTNPFQRQNCGGQYRSFHDWISGCPDNVDKELKRVRKSRGNHRRDKPPADSPLKAKAGSVLAYRGWGSAAERASRLRESIGEFIEVSRDIARRSKRSEPPNMRKWREYLFSVLLRFRRLPERTRQGLMARADRCFFAYTGRQPNHAACEDVNLRLAMGLSMLDQYSLDGRSPRRDDVRESKKRGGVH